MRKAIEVVCMLSLILTAALAVAEKAAKTPDGQSLVIVFKDGRQQSFSMADVARIEFQGSPSAATAASPDIPGRGHFLGKWELGQGNGSNFHVTLEANGDASKSIGSRHGTWTVVNGEARISWDDGSHDAIRKVGNKWEKFWYPDGNFSGKANNVTGAEHIESKPI